MALPRKPHQTRDALLQVGKNMLLSEGVDLDLKHINLESAHTVASVSRSSAFSAWSDLTSDDADANDTYRRAVLEEVLTDQLTTAGLQEAVLALSEVELPAQDSSKAEKRCALLEMVRIGGKAHIDAFARSRSWRLTAVVQGVLACRNLTEADHTLLDLLQRSHDTFNQEITETLYRPLLDLLGLRPKESITGIDAMKSFAFSASALAEGIVARSIFNEEAANGTIMMASDGDQLQQEWSLFSIAFLGLVDAFFEPND